MAIGLSFGQSLELGFLASCIMAFISHSVLNPAFLVSEPVGAVVCPGAFLSLSPSPLHAGLSVFIATLARGITFSALALSLGQVTVLETFFPVTIPLDVLHTHPSYRGDRQRYRRVALPTGQGLQKFRVVTVRFIVNPLERVMRGIRMGDIYHSIYEKLERIGVFRVRQYAVIEKPPYTALCIDRLEDSVFALSQNPIIDGIVVAEPDIEIRIFHEKKIAEPLCLQNHDGRRVVYPEPGKVDLAAKHDLAQYLDRWLSDLISQGFIRLQ